MKADLQESYYSFYFLKFLSLPTRQKSAAVRDQTKQFLWGSGLSQPLLQVLLIGAAEQLFFPCHSMAIVQHIYLRNTLNINWV